MKPKRPVSTYVFRDISPQPSTSQAPQLTPRKKKLINKCAKLKNKLTEKQRNIRNLKAKNKRMKAKVVTLQLVLDEFKKRPGLKNHLNEISLACSNEMLQNLVDRVNEKNAGKISHSKEYNEELKRFALTLHFYSPRCYNYIREKIGLCLPHVNTLRTWYKQVDCEPGFTAEAFNTIKEICKEKN